jgi:hypothetical protein
MRDYLYLSANSIRWLIAIAITLSASFAFGHGMSEAEKQTIIDGGNLRYIWIGATHMLSGFDHLAFVFGIVFFLTRFADVVKYVTAFTLGHSVTLILATLYAIQVNYFLVDAVIALSVCYVAFANLDGFKQHLNINPPNMLVMIIGLGLIHGLGLSTRLQSLPLSDDHLLMNIISFNVGIELGQISALAVMLVVISWFRKSDHFPTFSKIANIFLLFAGGFLFLMQMHDYQHAASAQELTEAELVAQTASVEGASSVSEPTNWADQVSVVIPANDGKEYKVFMAIDTTLSYTWQTDGGALFYDFHGEPEGDTTGYFKSYEKNTSEQASGDMTTVFAGTHGWYWQNTTSSPVTITLKVRGDYRLLE